MDYLKNHKTNYNFKPICGGCCQNCNNCCGKSGNCRANHNNCCNNCCNNFPCCCPCPPPPQKPCEEEKEKEKPKKCELKNLCKSDMRILLIGFLFGTFYDDC